MAGQDTGKPTVIQALRAVLQEDFPDELAVGHIEIRPTGSGQVTYRLWPSDGSDYVGGVCMVPTSS